MKKQINRRLCTLLLALLLAALSGTMVFAAEGDAGGGRPAASEDAATYSEDSEPMVRYAWYGDGTASSFTISSPSDLAGLANIVNGLDGRRQNSFAGKTIYLDADIDLSAYGTRYGGGKGWMAIGYYSYAKFKGMFNGNGHTVSGLFYRESNGTESPFGLFGYVSGQASGVCNLGVTNINVSVAGVFKQVGGIAGSVELGGTISNCYSTGQITGIQYLGGIAGALDSATVKNCWSSVDITAENGNSGGLVGTTFQAGSRVANSYSTGTVRGGKLTSVGGIIGGIFNGTVENCAALNDEIIGDGRVVGSIAGSNTLSGNVAYIGTLNNDGNILWGNRGADALDGADLTRTEITFSIGGRFSSSGGWTTQVGQLPGLFGNTVDKPDHLIVSNNLVPWPSSVTIERVSTTQATLNFTIGEPGRIYVLMRTSASEPPSADTIQSRGKVYGPFMDGTVTGLPIEVDLGFYYVYIIVQNVSGMRSSWNRVYLDESGVTPSENKILYVKADGAGTGSSFENPLKRLETALAHAKEKPDEVTEIRVAAGRHKPTIPVVDGGTSREAAYVLAPDVKVYGGFTGTEADNSPLDERDFVLNETILDADGAYHVVISSGEVGTAALDGFTLKGGNANGEGSVLVNDKIIRLGHAGGMYITNSSPRVANCIIAGNNAGESGGGIYLEGSSSRIENTVFRANTAKYGGGMCIVSGSPAISNCLFASNTATSIGGGIINSGSATVTNCTIAANTAKNTSGVYSGANSIILRNTILYGAVYGTPTYLSSLVDGVDLSESGGNLNGVDIAARDVFNDYDNGDYRLRKNAPVIDKGDSGFVPLSTATDLAGNARITGAAVDIGAYEYHDIPLSGTVTISETKPRVEYVLTGSLVGGNNTGVLSYTWKADGEVVGTNSETYTVGMADVGKVITLEITSDLQTGVLTSAATKAVAARAFALGNGTDSDPYIIADVDDLAQMATLIDGENPRYGGKAYKLADSVTILNLFGYTADGGWTPIGNSAKPFTGSFDANGKTIANLVISRSADEQGLFGHVGAGGSVRNLILENISIAGKKNTGAVAGFLGDGAALENCHVASGTVSGTLNLGGVVGEVRGVVSRCSNGAGISAVASVPAEAGTLQNVGGIAGLIYAQSAGQGRIERSFNTGRVQNITASDPGEYFGSRTGGIVGVAEKRGDFDHIAISDCYNTGDILGTGWYTGGIAGYVWHAKASHCYSTGSVSDAASNYGGITGRARHPDSGIHNSAALGKTVNGADENGDRVIGFLATTPEISNNYAWDGLKVNGNVTTSDLPDSPAGKDLTAAEVGSGEAFWKSSLTFSDSVWTIADGKLPALTSITAVAQSGTIPTHLISVPQATLAIGPMNDDTAEENSPYYKSILTEYKNGTAENLTYTVTGLPRGVTYSSSGHSGTISGTPEAGTSQNSPYTVNISVTDGTLTATGSYTLTVTDSPSPDQLILTTPTDLSVTVGEPFTKTLDVSYSGSNTLTYKATGLPDGVAIDDETGVIHGAASKAGGYTVEVTVEDGRLGDTKSFTLTVSPDVEFSPASHVNINRPTDLVFQADSILPSEACDFLSVRIENAAGKGRTLEPSDGIVYDQAAGTVTLPAEMFGRHQGSPLTAGTYTAVITFGNHTGSPAVTFDYSASFVLTSSYLLTVNNGSGGGDYAEGAQVPIAADPAPSGKVFDKWTGGDGGSFADDGSANTTFTMPGNAAAVTATYKNTSYSGVVYDLSTDEPIQGATVTLYRKENGAPVVWDASGYPQQNPLLTGTAGKYTWDVPEGSWQVTAEMDGYQTGYSDWLEVPPSRADVNIGLLPENLVPVTEIQLSERAVTIAVGGEVPLSITKILPENATVKSVNWSSSDSEIATVDKNGVITGIKDGTATITATAKDGSGVFASCIVTVLPTGGIPGGSIRMNKTRVQLWNDAPDTVEISVIPSRAMPLRVECYDITGARRIPATATDLPFEVSPLVLAGDGSKQTLTVISRPGGQGSALLRVVRTDDESVMAQCRIDVDAKPDYSGVTQPADFAGFQLGATSVTLHSRSSEGVCLTLLPRRAATGKVQLKLSAAEAIRPVDSGNDAKPNPLKIFDFKILDDSTVLATLKEDAYRPKPLQGNLKASYKGKLEIVVDTGNPAVGKLSVQLPETVTIKINKNKPKLTAAAIKTNTFYAENLTREIIISGAGFTTDDIFEMRTVKAAPNGTGTTKQINANHSLAKKGITFENGQVRFAAGIKTSGTLYLELRLRNWTRDKNGAAIPVIDTTGSSDEWTPVSVKLNAVNTAPAVKLASAGFKVYNTPASVGNTLRIVPKSSKNTLSEYRIEDITIDAVGTGAKYELARPYNPATDNGAVTVRPRSYTGKDAPKKGDRLTLLVTTADCTKPLALTARVSALVEPTAKVKLTASPKTVSLNPNVSEGYDITIGTNIAGYDLTGRQGDYVLTPPTTQTDITPPTVYLADDDTLRVETDDTTTANRSYRYRLVLKNAYSGKDTPALTLTVKVGKRNPDGVTIPAQKGYAGPRVSLTAKGKVDLSLPGSAVTVTARFTNYNGTFADAVPNFRFYTVTGRGSNKVETPVDAGLFTIRPAGKANTWLITQEKAMAKGAYYITVDKSSLTGGAPDAAVSATAGAKFTVAASKPKAAASPGAVTLYRSDKESLAVFRLTVPADAAKLNHEQIDKTGLVENSKSKYFTLKSLGGGWYAVGFNAANWAQAESATLTLNLYTKGNTSLNKSGAPAPVTTLKLKVNVKR